MINKQNKHLGFSTFVQCCEREDYTQRQSDNPYDRGKSPYDDNKLTSTH